MKHRQPIINPNIESGESRRNRWCGRATAFLFVGILFGFSLLHLLLPDGEVSTAEKRRLASLPSFSWSAFESGVFMTNFEKYTLDQFPLRDAFRSLKAGTEYGLFAKKDNNGIYLAEGCLSKIEYPMNERSLLSAAEGFNRLAEETLAGCTAYFAVIPDKNYFLAEKHGMLSMDYDRFCTVFYGALSPDIEQIPLFDTLSIGDYYRTDTHWRQDCLGKVTARLGERMGFSDRLTEIYETRIVEDFAGAYLGQSALPMKKDRIVYLTSPAIEGAKVTNLETGATTVYNLGKLTDGKSLDNYDLFLDGAAALLTIENPLAETDDELILFRDSFGSSLAPLLIEAYRRIDVVDLRYLSSSYLPSVLDIHGQDVLFLYSTSILNNSQMLRLP